MNEKTVRTVMIRCLKSKGIKPISSRGAGPDLLINGKAVEVNFNRMLKQVVDYDFKYSDIGLALPPDGLNLKRVLQLEELFKEAS